MLLVSLVAAAVIFIYGLVTYWKAGRDGRQPADITSQVTEQTRRLTSFPTAATVADRALKRAAIGDSPLALQLREGLRVALTGLAETELPTVPDQGAATSDEQHQARLLKHLAKISNPTYLADLEGFLAGFAQAILGALRIEHGDWSTSAWPEGLGERSLVELMPDPAGAVAAIVDGLLQDSPPGQFLLSKSILAANIGIAGDAAPRDFAGSREALAQAYLYGTPFFDFFYLPISRQWMVA